MHDVMMSPLYWIAVGLYLLLTPLQEFVARSCLQAPLFRLPSTAPRFWRHGVVPSLVSNLVFASAHSHISFTLRHCGVYSGPVLGVDFSRAPNSLIAASASHFMIGGAGIFLFGIEEIIAKLTAMGGMGG